MMHSFILGLSKEIHIDHKDGNGLNNTRDNLRIATQRQNNMNCGLRSDSTSGYKGVSFHKNIKRWMAGIRVNKKRLHLGYFDSPAEAAIAYNEAAIKYFGEFARLNVLIT